MSGNSSPQFSDLIRDLISALRGELRESERELGRNRRRQAVEDGDCDCEYGHRRRWRMGRTATSRCPSEKPIVCKDNPKRCQCIGGQWVVVENNPSVLLSNQIIDQAISFTRAGSYDKAEAYVISSIDDLCGPPPGKYPFPFPLPRDFNPSTLTEEDFYLAAVEFRYAAEAILINDGDENARRLQELFFNQAERLIKKFTARGSGGV